MANLNKKDITRIIKKLKNRRIAIKRISKKKEFNHLNGYFKNRLDELEPIIKVLEEGFCKCKNKNILVLKGNVVFCKKCNKVVYK